jgi:hypothetical protein
MDVMQRGLLQPDPLARHGAKKGPGKTGAFAAALKTAARPAWEELLMAAPPAASDYSFAHVQPKDQDMRRCVTSDPREDRAGRPDPGRVR